MGSIFISGETSSKHLICGFLCGFIALKPNQLQEPQGIVSAKTETGRKDVKASSDFINFNGNLPLCGLD